MGAAQEPFPEPNQPEPTCMVGSNPVPEGLLPDVQEFVSAEEELLASEDVESAEDAAMVRAMLVGQQAWPILS